MKIESSNEIDLVRQTLNGDTSAFDRLVKIHRTTIYALVLSYIKNPADAEDLTQRIFIRAYERLATLRELNRFRPWLLQIAHNTCKDWIRWRSSSPTRFEATNDTDFAEVAPSPEDIALKVEIKAVVRQAISALRETDRRLMEARYIEGADYDQLQVESGLSYAAIANRLKRAKREIRHRIEKLLGCVAILPSRTFILGGIEAVKLSVKAKLAAVGVAAVIGIGGGGMMYHHTFESNPVAVNEQAISEMNAVTGDLSTKVVNQADATLGNSSSMNGASIPKKGEANRFEMSADGYGVKPVKIVKLKDSRKVVRKLLERGLSEEELERLPVEEIVEAIIEISENIEITENRGDGDSDTITQVFESEHELEGSFLAIGTAPNPLTEEELKQKVASGEFTATQIQVKSEDEGTSKEITWYMSEGTQLSEGLIKRLQEMVNKRLTHIPAAGSTPSTSTESQPSSAHSVLTSSETAVESTATSSERSESTAQFSGEDWAEVEKLLSEFSDEDWAELDRLLRDSAVEKTPQRDEGALLTPKQQQQIEKVVEKTLVDPSVQKMQRQRRLPLENDTHALPPKTDGNMGQ
jgi:RNA polymerase sigma-70 factor (ECF subfamily)